MKGTYTLLITCAKPFRTKIGSLGCATIRKGHYLYTGSALGYGSVSLEGRLSRHLRMQKKVNWHVDHLTSNPLCSVKAIVFLRSSKRLECSINQAIVRNLKAKPILPRAGSSDCNCKGHLTRVRNSIGTGKILANVTSVYLRFGRAVRYMEFGNRKSKKAGQF